MPFPLSPLLATALVSAGTPRPASVSTPAGRDPLDRACEEVASLPGDRSCDSQPLCSPRERVHLACGLAEALEKRYVFFPVKARLLEASGVRFDPARHLAACVGAERAIAREDDPLRFYDRMRACVAAFRDGHLLLGAPARLPQVALGIGLRLVSGRVVIANRERKLVSYLASVSGMRDLGALLAVGNEVAEIDGRPAAEAIAELARYIPASSDAARLEHAVDALTRRDFDYPPRRTAAITVVSSEGRRTVELPWWISPDAEAHAMTRAYARRVGLATTDLLTWRYDRRRDAWEREPGQAEGYLRTDTILPPPDAGALREYTDDQGRLAVRMGEVVRRRDRAFCYLQVLTFFTESLAGHEGREPFAKPIGAFLRRCKEKDLDLVLDLRQNAGGYLAHTSALFAMLAEEGKTYAGGALLLRASTSNQLIYEQRTPALGGIPARAGDPLAPAFIADAIGTARRGREDFTPAFLERPLSASAAVGGYPGRVMALVAPTCMSACDRIGALLKSSGRAILVGGATEGAGGSQQETPGFPARWTDPEGLISLSMPNAAMGVEPAAAARAVPARSERSAPAFFQSLSFENRPVPPDVPYSTRIEDVQGVNRGWLAEVDRVLFEGARRGADPRVARSAQPGLAGGPVARSSR